MMNGGDIFKLQKILGHKSVQMTMRYAHLSPDAFSKDFDRLNRFETNPESSVVQLYKQ
jgi:integrase